MSLSLGNAVLTLRADPKSLQKDMTVAQNSVQRAMKKMSISARQVGIGMTIAGAAIAGGLGLAVKSALTFSTALAEVNTLGIEDLGALGGAIKEISQEFGIELVDATKAAYQAISAGASELTAPDILRDSAIAATAGISDLTTAVDLGMGVMNAYGDSVSGINQVFDEAFIAVQKGVTNFGELAASVGKLSPTFRAVGLSSAEMFASIAALTKGGIATAEAVTGMAGVIEAVSKPTTQAAKAAKELGIEFNTTSLRAKGLVGFMQMIKEATGGNIDIIKQLVGERAGANAVLALAGEQAQVFASTMDLMADSTGAAKDAFNAFVSENQAAFKLDQLKASMTVLAVEIGDTLLPILEKMTSAMLPIVKSISSWVAANPGWAKALTIAAAVIAAVLLALGPLLIMLPGIVVAFGLVTAAVSLVSVPFIAFGALVAIVVAAVVLAVTLMVKAWQTQFENIKKLFVEFGDGIASGFDAAIGFVKAGWDSIVGIFTGAYDVIKSIMGWIGDLIGSMMDAVGGAVSVVGDLLGLTGDSEVPRYAHGTRGGHAWAGYRWGARSVAGEFPGW